MNKGIIIIATKNKIYGRMAYNLALTIKATGTKIPVACVYDREAVSGLSASDVKIFDFPIGTDWDWNKVRFNIDQFTPFDHTMQLDADMLWLWRDPQELFDKYADEELMVTNEGFYNIDTKEEKLTGGYKWLSDLDQSINAYELKGQLYQMRWELLLFKKTERIRQMFELAESIREKPLVETWKFEGQTVDEFCFYVACNKLQLTQKEAPFIASWWCKRLSNPTIGTINKDYYAVGFGGNTANKEYKKMYNLIMHNACQKMGLSNRYSLQSKKDHLTSRIAI